MTDERSGKGGKLCFADFDTAEPHLIFYKYSEKTNSSPIPRLRFCIKCFVRNMKNIISMCVSHANRRRTKTTKITDKGTKKTL